MTVISPWDDNRAHFGRKDDFLSTCAAVAAWVARSRLFLCPLLCVVEMNIMRKCLELGCFIIFAEEGTLNI